MKWRVVDIAVSSVIGVASALIYWAVAFFSAAPWSVLEAVVPGLAGIFNGLWLVAGPLAAVIVCKPGAALYAEVVAGVLESAMGAHRRRSGQDRDRHSLCLLRLRKQNPF